MIHDTTPEAQRLRWRILARMSGEQRVRQALELTDFVLQVHAEGARARETSDALEDAEIATSTRKTS